MPLPLVPDDGTNGANDLIAKIDELVQHRHRPEPKTISQIVYERYHPFEAFEETLQDAWELGEPVRREKAGMGCCSDKKPSAPSSGCGCGPKTPQTKSGGCGCGPKKGDPERIEGGGCGCSAPTVPSPTGKSKKLEDLTLVDKDIANKIYRLSTKLDSFAQVHV
ncbi:unnamed protein product [Notodromas monacha]|uniref:Uncharacterized protein n=1 Tax=Notodromas monacha TaxID=399045 RepID=A0A7R9BGT7_9CRUS|nr:unnamed protein product [Notodromas monacha]CAG0913846.1 unnamed protein product [Notodromas monacha]